MKGKVTLSVNQMGHKLSFLIGLRYCSNVNSFTKIYDIDGNGMFYRENHLIISQFVSTFASGTIFLIYLERNGLILKQAEWNILQMGTTKYEKNCKQMRFKTVYLETSHLSIHKTIPVMTDQIIDVSNNQLIHFLNGLKSKNLQKMFEW